MHTKAHIKNHLDQVLGRYVTVRDINIKRNRKYGYVWHFPEQFQRVENLDTLAHMGVKDQQFFRAGLANGSIFAECTEDKTDEVEETSSQVTETNTIQVPIQSSPYIPKRNQANTTPKIANTKAPSAKSTNINKLIHKRDYELSKMKTQNTAKKISNNKRPFGEEIVVSDQKDNPVKKQLKIGETQNIIPLEVPLAVKNSHVLTNISLPDVTAIRNAMLNGVAGVTDLVKSLVNDMQQGQVGNRNLQNQIADRKEEVTRLQMEKKKLQENVSEMITNKAELLKQIIGMEERITSLEATSLTKEQWEKCMEL